MNNHDVWFHIFTSAIFLVFIINVGVVIGLLYATLFEGLQPETTSNLGSLALDKKIGVISVISNQLKATQFLKNHQCFCKIHKYDCVVHHYSNPNSNATRKVEYLESIIRNYTSFIVIEGDALFSDSSLSGSFLEGIPLTYDLILPQNSFDSRFCGGFAFYIRNSTRGRFFLQSWSYYANICASFLQDTTTNSTRTSSKVYREYSFQLAVIELLSFSHHSDNFLDPNLKRPNNPYTMAFRNNISTSLTPFKRSKSLCINKKRVISLFDKVALKNGYGIHESCHPPILFSKVNVSYNPTNSIAKLRWKHPQRPSKIRKYFSQSAKAFINKIVTSNRSNTVGHCHPGFAINPYSESLSASISSIELKTAGLNSFIIHTRDNKGIQSRYQMTMRFFGITGHPKCGAHADDSFEYFYSNIWLPISLHIHSFFVLEIVVISLLILSSLILLFVNMFYSA